MECLTNILCTSGDVTLSAEDLPPQSRKLAGLHLHGKDSEPILTLDNEPGVLDEEAYDYDYDLEEEDHAWAFGPTARYLLAGGIAGAGIFLFLNHTLHRLTFLLVSRTATAPFDRLKIFLITRPPDLGGLTGGSTLTPTHGAKAILSAVARLYAEGGIRAFWVGECALQWCSIQTKTLLKGNGLNLVKIFPVCINWYLPDPSD